MSEETCRKSSAAEGVTLSGSGNRKDCKWMTLWRSPLDWMPKVKVRKCKSLRQKDRAIKNLSQRDRFCSGDCLYKIKAVFYFKEEF